MRGRATAEQRKRPQNDCALRRSKRPEHAPSSAQKGTLPHNPTAMTRWTARVESQPGERNQPPPLGCWNRLFLTAQRAPKGPQSDPFVTNCTNCTSLCDGLREAKHRNRAGIAWAWAPNVAGVAPGEYTLRGHNEPGQDRVPPTKLCNVRVALKVVNPGVGESRLRTTPTSVGQSSECQGFL